MEQMMRRIISFVHRNGDNYIFNEYKYPSTKRYSMAYKTNQYMHSTCDVDRRPSIKLGQQEVDCLKFFIAKPSRGRCNFYASRIRPQQYQRSMHTHTGLPRGGPSASINQFQSLIDTDLCLYLVGNPNHINALVPTNQHMSISLMPPIGACSR